MKLFAAAATLVLVALTASAQTSSAERVQCRDGKTWIWQGGVSSLAQKKVTFPENVVVETNATYTVAGGRVRQLLEGESIGADGRLLRPDGSTVPVIDHITLDRGTVMVMRDGDYQQLRESLQLPSGMSIRPDAKITLPDGSSRRLLDGELLRLRGDSIPAKDTVTVQNGKVFVQKDGAMIELGAGRTIMMNNGTKVFSDGTFVDANGRRGRVSDQEIALIEGVVVRPR